MIIAGNAPLSEPFVIWCLDLKNIADLLLAPSIFLIGIMETVVSTPCPLGTIILIMFCHKNIDSRAIFRNGRIVPIPLRCSVEIGCILLIGLSPLYTIRVLPILVSISTVEGS